MNADDIADARDYLRKHGTVWPCTITAERYGGVYSGKPWIAFPADAQDGVTRYASEGDPAMMKFWFDGNNELLAAIGTGDTPQLAYDDLVAKLSAF